MVYFPDFNKVLNRISAYIFKKLCSDFDKVSQQINVW